MKIGRKSEAGLVIVLVLAIAAFFIGWLVNLSQRECRGNNDCSSSSYCGSDFSCHEFPLIQQTISQYSLVAPAIILAIAIIAAAVILRWNIEFKRHSGDRPKEIQHQQTHEATETEPYYQQGQQRKTP
ncbi:hypothetical protein HYS31_07595 [Candidatus Woesearchaeota archaeon]|nr:hypothetical protein [Candidatus Woesearchaeota archaeon]